MIKILILLVGLFLGVNSANAITLNQTKIGSTTITTSAGIPLAVWQALSAYRSLPTPVKALVTIGTPILFQKAADFISEYAMVPGASNPLNGYVPLYWTDWNTAPSSMPARAMLNDPNANMQLSASTLQDLCSAWGSATNAYYGCGTGGKVCGTPSYNSTIGYCQRTSQVNGGTISSFGVPASIGCPTGFSYNSTSQLCTLSNAATAQHWSDNIPTFRQNPTTHNWYKDPRDPDSSNPTPSTDTMTRTGTDVHSNPIKETFKNNPDGGMTYSRDSQTIDQTTGKDIVQHDTIQYDQYGNIVNSTTTTEQTTINNINNGITPVYEIDTSSLNQEATQQQVLQKLTDIANKPSGGTGEVTVNIPQITVSGDGGQLDKTLPQTETAESALTRLKAHISTNSIIAPLLNPSPASGTCPMLLQVNMGPFGNHSTNVMCDLYELMIPTLDVVTKFAWSLAAIFIFFSA